MLFDSLNYPLPVAGIIPELRLKLAENSTAIVQAAPGAGKSTLLPLALMNEPWLEGKKILMLEPRRLAARSIAWRMSDMLGTECGKEIGYRVRFDNRVSASTKIEVVTEGILTRMLQSDNSLEQVGLVVFDEFHERSIHADLALALCREAQQILRPELRILIMSATLDMPKLSSLLKAPVIQSEGGMFPVDIRYVGGQDERMISETAARVIIQAAQEEEGDILAFFPGEAEIKRCADLLFPALKGFAIHPLFGMLPQHEQQAAIQPNKSGKRKVVLATSIAETSLTIEGVRIVVDTGLGRIQRFDPATGLSRLETIQISRDSADQRAGRAGRLYPGVCYRMWTAATHNRLADHRTPEIEQADLASLVLELACWGVNDVGALNWLNEPPKAHVAQAYDLLDLLGALENKKLSAHGKRIHQLACHPRIAHMLLLAQDEESQALACDIAAILEERDPLPRESGIDINLRIDALRRARKENAGSKKFQRLIKLAESYRSLLKIQENNQPTDPFLTGLLVSHAYPERIASARPGNNAQFQLSNGKIAMAGHKDDLANESWLAIAHMDSRDGLGKIFLAAPLNPKDLLPMVKERENISWNSRKAEIVAAKELRIGNILLQSKPLNSPSEAKVVAVLLHAIKKEWESLLHVDSSFDQLVARICSLRKWNPEENWPDLSKSLLFEQEQEWLEPYLRNCRNGDDLEKIKLSEALLSSLDWELQQKLNLLAPEKIKVPSGSELRIEYFENGEIPVLAVRLQEMFGVPETPRINQGKIGVVLHLLSPGFKPVQVTRDLKNFWNTTYFEVKSELQRRYPKHSWPDDPWTATPVAKGRPRN
ncbi:MAG: ATP-dependent helicase HrpB [Bacteroidia bacterium]|nr:ATP-dependent helicase HrpB [Bacteroidia bacterium]